MKTILTHLSALGLCLTLLTGCANLSDTQRATLVGVAKLALSFGLAELGDRVKEVRPFQDKLKGLINVTFSQPGKPEELGAKLKAAVVKDLPPALVNTVLETFREALTNSKTVAAAPGNADFNQRVAAAL